MKANVPPGIVFDTHPDHPRLAEVRGRILDAFGGSGKLQMALAQMLRSTLDDVIDAPNTGRRSFAQLEKTEKTYLGTKVEIVLRRLMGFPKGSVMDLNIHGTETDIKFTIGNNWMIPPEAMGHICLLVAADEKKHKCWMGLFRASDERLTMPNRDGKRGIMSSGFDDIMWLVRGLDYAPNFWRTVPQEITDEIFARPGGGSVRVQRLFTLLPRRPIPSKVVVDVARQVDPLRRTRANGGARDGLPPSYALLTFPQGRAAVAALGLPELTKGDFMSIDIRTPEEARIIDESPHTMNRRKFAEKHSSRLLP